MDTISLNGAVFPLSDAGLIAEEAARTEYKYCCGVEKKLFNRIQKAVDGFTRRLRVHAYVSSHACLYVAMIEQARDLEAAKRLPLTVYLSLSKQFSLFKPIPEPTEYWDKPKSKGGARRLHDFGPMNRAAQHMVMRVISTIFKPRQFQYNVTGRGPARAIKTIREMVGDGYSHVQKLDVKGFFDSFSREVCTSSSRYPSPSSTTS